MNPTTERLIELIKNLTCIDNKTNDIILHHKRLTNPNKALCCKQAYNTHIIRTKYYVVICMFYTVSKVEGGYLPYASETFCNIVYAQLGCCCGGVVSSTILRDGLLSCFTLVQVTSNLRGQSEQLERWINLHEGSQWVRDTCPSVPTFADKRDHPLELRAISSIRAHCSTYQVLKCFQ